MKPKYPEIEVQLVGGDGNAFVILTKVQNALRRAKVSAKEIDAFLNDAQSGDYNHLLATCQKWVAVK